MSQALYREYRPQKFDDVIGQEVAVRTLRNAIETDRVAHAYLFTGTRGTGKTTTAKLLAKAMNCEQGPTTDPCGVCSECVAIAEGRSVNVLEIDAASNTGVQDVRDRIIDTVNYQPSNGTRRVYIIDEAHMLSTSAFNALLKTIEEPPPHVLFVFCTTETHKMPATVRDRCQRLVMKSPGPDTLVKVITSVCAQEGITADEPAMRAVARAAQGSFRNALGMLEMLTTTFGTTFSLDEVLQHLGVVAEELLFDATDALIDGNAGAVLGLVEQLVQDGVDLDQFARSLAEHLRMVLLQLHGLEQYTVVGDAARLKTQAERADERRVLAAIDCIGDAATRMRVGSDPRISIETALVRASQGLGLPLLALRLAALEQAASGSYGQPLPSGQAAAPVAAPPARPASAPAAVAPAPAPAAPAASAAPAAAIEPLADSALADVTAWWPQVAKLVAKSPAHRPVLQQLAPESASNTGLVLRAGSPMPVSAKLRDALSSAAFEVTGRKLSVEVLEPVVTATPAAGSPAAAPASAAPAPAPAKAAARATTSSAATPAPLDGDEGIENLMSMFDATPVTASDDDAQ
jgi:DNA polymerase-3 subunit gamma/tau